jgi:hypothetical protein
MNRHALLALSIVLMPWKALAGIGMTPPPAADHLCRQAINAAERAHGIPSHLLASIARVESGRRDQATGSFNPWPWTINADGQGAFYETKADAVAAARTARSQVSKSVDVGCMQISLTYHPDAFPTLEQAFDPVANADYGARFLVQLYEKSGSWPRAVEMYHSATLGLGEDYGRKVYAALPIEQKLALDDPTAFENATPSLAARAFAMPWVPPISRNMMLSTAFRPTAPRVILQATDTPGGAPPAGRTLDSYRAAPVRLAFRTP